MRAWIAAAALAALTAACAPVVQGGSPLALAPELAAAARVDTLYLSSDWLRSEDDFADTFTDEVREELSRCATGSRRLDLRVHLEDLRRADRTEVLITGEGQHALSGVAEFTDPARGNAIVGRYPIRVATDAGGRLGALVGDRQMMAAEAWGRALCLDAFGRNPRGPSITNATAD